MINQINNYKIILDPPIPKIKERKENVGEYSKSNF